MRLVLDTNIVVSALLWGGKPRRIIAAVEQGLVLLFTSLDLIIELEETISKPKFAAKIAAFQKSPTEILTEFKDRVSLVQPLVIPRVALDPDDDVVIGTALAAEADAIVSGDTHLLQIARYLGVQVLKAADVLARLERLEG